MSQLARTPRSLALAGLLLLSPGPAGAEPYGGLVVGVAFTRDTDVDQKVFGTATFEDIGFDTSIVFGGKAGYFFETPVLGGNTGLELEVYHFRPDIGTQTVGVSANGLSGTTTFRHADLHVTAIGLNGLYRFPLARSAEFPQGRFHPYAGVGLGAFIARFETRTTALDVPTDFGDTDVRVGAQALAGARFFLMPHVALFGGERGDEIVRRLIGQASTHLAPGGLLALEMGIGQADDLAALMAEKNYHDIETERDYAGVIRFLFGRYG